mgnify:CR=1 FL=1|tara:strand:+ start:1844 stop:2209 length:366 start_codon:yes stop_codon:yes gene_type:complete
MIKAGIRVAESVARTATQTFEQDSNNLSNGVFIVNITAGATAVNTVIITIDGYDDASETWYNILTSSTLISVEKTILRVGGYTPSASSSSVEDFLPKKFRVVATKNNATVVTYSIGVNLSD